MNYLAMIRVGSAIDRQWRLREQRSGLACGIDFVLTTRGFESRDPLTADQVAAVANNPSIIVAAAVAPLPSIAQDPEPDIAETGTSSGLSEDPDRLSKPSLGLTHPEAEHNGQISR